MIVYHHRGGWCCTIDYNPPNSFYVYEKSPRERPPSYFLVSLCAIMYFWSDRRLKLTIDQGVLVTLADLASLSP